LLKAVGGRLSPNVAQQQHQFKMASSSGTKLAQEIHDEFLVCKICLESYKNPKSLACLHTFCEDCIENHIASESTYKKYAVLHSYTCIPGLWSRSRRLGLETYERLVSRKIVNASVSSRSRPFTSLAQNQFSAKLCRPQYAV